MRVHIARTCFLQHESKDVHLKADFPAFLQQHSVERYPEVAMNLQMIES